jgi:hypothetical protein
VSQRLPSPRCPTPSPPQVPEDPPPENESHETSFTPRQRKCPKCGATLIQIRAIHPDRTREPHRPRLLYSTPRAPP